MLGAHLWKAAEVYGLQKMSKRQTFEAAMNIFFRQPTPLLSSLSEETLGKLAGRRIGVQIRIGHNERARYSGSLQSVVDCFVAETLRECDRNCSVFLTTDSKEAHEVFMSAMKAHNQSVATIAGDFLHVDMSSGDFLKTYADWLVLTRMNSLVASRSGYSETAGWFGNIPARGLVTTDTCLFSASVELADGSNGL